jgi:FMN phosphatase YigB (HAD superfamily)
MTSPTRTAHLAPPKAVVFDLGKVLLDFDYQRAAQTLGVHSDLSVSEFKRVVDQSPLLHRYETGLLTTREFVDAVRRTTGYRGPDDLFHRSFGDIFREIPDMVAMHRKLRDRNVPTYVFSNTNELAVQHIRSTNPFFSEFTGYVYSYEARSMKPHPRIYEALESLAGLRGADLLYLDDRPENVAAGAARGWRTILHHDAAASIAEVNAAFGF